MKITQKYFDKYLKKNYLFENSPKVCVAVSGGPDSMCLLFLLNKWIKKYNGSLIALIINHDLRIESALEAKYIYHYLSNLKINAKIIKINKSKILKKSMAESRNNRFNSLINFCKKNKILHLFLGHHLDDNLETFLMRKIAGSNFEGLGCIKNKVVIDKLQILRPLIEVNKKEILKYNKINRIKFVLDPSNTNLNYTRTIIRNFLYNERYHKNKIIKDFENIKKNQILYLKMIFQSFHEVIFEITNNYIILNSKKFFIKDELIQSKIIEIIYRYLKFSRDSLRFKKIAITLKNLKISNSSSLNLAGLIIKKESFMIKFIG